jgi:hypothetical protein
MAVKKSSGETKIQDESARKKAGGKKSAAKKETAPKKSTPSAAKSAASKKAAKKAAAPLKLTTAQTDLLKKIGESAEPGYRSEKKAEQRTIDALQERKLIKRGAKDKASGSYHYQISSAGKKHLGTTQAGGDAGTPPPPPPTANP